MKMNKKLEFDLNVDFARGLYSGYFYRAFFGDNVMSSTYEKVAELFRKHFAVYAFGSEDKDVDYCSIDNDIEMFCDEGEDFITGGETCPVIKTFCLERDENDYELFKREFRELLSSDEFLTDCCWDEDEVRQALKSVCGEAE